MTAMTARNVHITDQLLAVLADEPLPVPTSYLLGKLDLRGYQNTVLRLLNRLTKRGEVEKWAPAGPLLSDTKCCYWRRLSPVEAAERTL
jgi:hypothetical protein